MTFQCAAVLRGLKKLTNNSETDISFLGSTTCFCLLSDINKCFDYDKYQNEINGILDELEKNGYLVFTTDKNNFRLTHKAVHSKQFSLRSFIKVFVLSFLLPIAASIVTTLVTLWLKLQ